MEEKIEDKFVYKFSLFCGFFALGVGFISLAGWILKSPELASLFLPLIPIHYFNSICFSLCGGAFLLICFQRNFSSIILAAIVILFSTLYLIEGLFARSVMTWAAPSIWGAKLVSFATSKLFLNSLVSFVLTGCSLLLLSMPARKRSILLLCSQILASLVFIIAANGLLSFILGFYEPTVLAMFPPTAITFLLLAIGIFEYAFAVQKMYIAFRNRSVFIANIFIALFALQFFHLPQALLFIIPAIVAFNVSILFFLNEKMSELHASQRKLHTVIESCQDAILYIDRKGTIVGWNSGAENIFGYAKEEIIGKPLTVIMPDRYLASRISDSASLFDDQERARKIIEMQGKRKLGEEFPLELSLSMWESDGGRFYTGIVRDITESKKAEELSKQAKELAEAASRMKSEFLANMSHEIRTPMTAILGYTDLLLNPTLSVSNRLDFIQIIRRNGQLLLQIINDILDLAKIEAGKLSIVQGEAHIPSILVDVLSLMRQQAFGKGIAISMDYRSPIPEKIATDPHRLKQILINLLGNAIKFTEKGGVHLSVHMVTSQDESNPQIQFDIEDTGIGMTEEQLAKIFQPFVQADAGITKQFGGTGLGLAIVKHLVELLSGKLICKSEPGKGSLFSFTIPTGSLQGIHFIQPKEELMEEQPQKAITDTPQVKGKILLAEDGIDNQRLISFLLTQMGLEVEVAENGKIAYEKAIEKSDAGAPFDLILMDMQMPIMDGYAATSMLRNKGYQGAIIALTAFAMVEDKNKCLNVGCNTVITKPINHEEFASTIQQYLSKSPAQETPSEPIYSTYSDTPMMTEMIATFVSNLPLRLAAITSSLQQNDSKAVQMLAHQLKGAAGSYGFPQISEKAAELEKLCQNTDSKNQVVKVFEELKSICERTQVKKGTTDE